MTNLTENNKKTQECNIIEDKIHIVCMLFDCDIEYTEDKFIARALNDKKEELDLLYKYYIKTGNDGARSDLENQLARYYSFYLAYPGYDGITRLWPVPSLPQ